MKHKIITVLISSVLASGAFSNVGNAQGFTDEEQACFNLVDQTDYPPIEQNYRVINGLRQCKSSNDPHTCIVNSSRFRPSKKVLQVVMQDDCSKSQVNFGNLGWARQNLAIVCNTQQIQGALLIDQGMENSEVDTADESLINFILSLQSKFVAEMRCLRQTPYCKTIAGRACYGSFNEVQPIL